MKVRSKKGFTLVELIVAVTLTAVVIGGACSVFYLVSASFKNGTVSASSQQKALLVEEYLRKYAGTAYSVDKEEKDKAGIAFSIADDTLTVGEHTTSSSPDKPLATVEGIRRIDFSVDSANSLNYTVSFPDTDYTFRGGIVLNNCSGTTPAGAVYSGGAVLFLGTSA